MDTSPKSLEHLFAQLGLDNHPEAIEQFIQTHAIHRTAKIEEAPFWNDAQRAFLCEATCQDAEWSDAVDTLNTLLHSTN